MKKIKLTQGKFALVDDEDFEYLNQWNWHAKKRGYTFYAYRTKYYFVIGVRKEKRIAMHRVILNLSNPKKVCDHKNRNGLDNRRVNLRKCSISENIRNCIVKRKGKFHSKYKGVTKTTTGKYRNEYWVSYINYKGVHYNLGLFPFTKSGEKMAAKLYNDAALKKHKKFANLNIL